MICKETRERSGREVKGKEKGGGKGKRRRERKKKINHNFPSFLPFLPGETIKKKGTIREHCNTVYGCSVALFIDLRKMYSSFCLDNPMEWVFNILFNYSSLKLPKNSDDF
jgi:hypothetical protein